MPGLRPAGHRLAYAPTDWRRAMCRGTSPRIRRPERNGCSASTPPRLGRVWTPQNHWLGLDPTNDQLIDERYIVVGWGRDYADVPPLLGHHLHRIRAQRHRRLGRRRTVRGRGGPCVTSSARTAGSTWPSRTRCACRATAGSGSRWTRWRSLVIASGQDSTHGGAVDASEYQLCANLHAAECNWLVEVAPVRRLCQSCALTRTRPRTPTPPRWRRSRSPKAKRRLIAELHELKLPIVGRDADPSTGWPSTCSPAPPSRCSPVTRTG